MTDLGLYIVREIKSATSGERLNDFLDGYLDIAMPFHNILSQLSQLEPDAINNVFLEVLQGSPDHAEHFFEGALSHMVDWDNFENIKNCFDRKIINLKLSELK